MRLYEVRTVIFASPRHSFPDQTRCLKPTATAFAGRDEIINGKPRRPSRGEVDYVLRVMVNVGAQPVALAPAFQERPYSRWLGTNSFVQVVARRPQDIMKERHDSIDRIRKDGDIGCRLRRRLVESEKEIPSEEFDAKSTVESGQRGLVEFLGDDKVVTIDLFEHPLQRLFHPAVSRDSSPTWINNHPS